MNLIKALSLALFLGGLMIITSCQKEKNDSSGLKLQFEILL